MSTTRKLTDAQKKHIAAKQFHRCANSNTIQLKGIEEYNCPLWNKTENQGLFDLSGYDIDHIIEHCLTGDDSESNFATRLLSFCCVEGLFFSGSFCSIFWSLFYSYIF